MLIWSVFLWQIQKYNLFIVLRVFTGLQLTDMNNHCIAKNVNLFQIYEQNNSEPFLIPCNRIIYISENYMVYNYSVHGFWNILNLSSIDNHKDVGKSLFFNIFITLETN